MSIAISTSVPNAIPFDEIPGPDDWFVWDVDSSAPASRAVLVCFRSWFAPGRWIADLAAICHHAG
jgi:hypothetical protein